MPFFIVALMRPLRVIAVYIVAIFGGGALLAPWLYWLVKPLVGGFPSIAHAPFHRFVDRALLGLALIGLWPLLRAFDMMSLRDVGIVRPAGHWKAFAGGVLLGLLSLAIVAVFALATGAREVNAKLSEAQVFNKCLGALVGAMVVATLEEILFRGALFGALRRAYHWVFALVLSSAIYALMHFVKSAKDPTTVTWLSGLQLLPRMFTNMGNLNAIVPALFTLTIAGLLLGWAYQITSNLSFSVGLHAGWIFSIKVLSIVTHATPDANAGWWGSGRMAIVNGWLALPVVALTLLIFMRLNLARNREWNA